MCWWAPWSRRRSCLLLVALAMITGRSGASTDYYTHYRNVTGLRYRRAGVLRGLPHRPGRRDHAGARCRPQWRARTRYKVELAVRRDWPIPKDSLARLTATGLLADVAIGISEGSSKEVAAPGSELTGTGKRGHLLRRQRTRRAADRTDPQPDRAADQEPVAARRFDRQRDRQEHAGTRRAVERAAAPPEQRVGFAQRRAQAGEPRGDRGDPRQCARPEPRPARRPRTSSRMRSTQLDSIARGKSPRRARFRRRPARDPVGAVRPHRFDHPASGSRQPQLRRVQPRDPQESESPAAGAEGRQGGGEDQ